MPGISGSDLAITSARSGVLRSGAGRSDWPILAGVVVPTYAQSGVTRSGATRSNYHSPITAISIAGTHYGAGRAVDAEKVLAGSLSISDLLNDTPNTARFRTKGFIPTVGQEVVITLGSQNNLDRRLAGQILNVTQGNVGSADNYFHDVSVIDFTWGLNKRKVSGYYTGSATTIAESLISAYASGYTSDIEQGLATVDGGITFTNQDLTDCLSQLAKRAGARWYVDYHKVVRLFLDETEGTAPTLMNLLHLSLTDLSVTRDLSQIVTRVYVEGGGVTAAATVAVGETILPLDGDPAWYDAAGGTVVSGPQRITYTGVSTGGGGGLVGTGASPSGAPVVALASGAGIEDGAHIYGVTFVTAAGETIASPLATVTHGDVAAPTSAPTAGTPTIGTGPDPGSHDYAVTYVTSAGETTASATVTKATATTTAPSVAPTPGTVTAGSGVDVGLHDYAVTFVTAIGETEPSAISGGVNTVAGVSAPSSAPVAEVGGTTRPGAGLDAGAVYGYKVTFWDGGSRETTPSTAGTFTADNYPSDNAGAVQIASLPTPPTGFQLRFYRTEGGGATYKLLPSGQAAGQFSENNGAGYYIDTKSDASLGAAAPGSDSTQLQQIPLTAIPTGDANVTSRKLYRRSGGAGLKLLATIADNTTTTYSDTTANASLGAAAPTASTAYVQRIPLSAIPVSASSLVTSKNVYGTAAGGSQLKLIANIAAAATTYTVVATDASLGANIPVSNTAATNQSALSSIPIGASTVTQRKVYRTATGAAQLKLLATIADNTTTTYSDTTADASLGANVPISDTSGLTQPQGNVLAGSTSLQVASIGSFASAGWAVIGNGQQVIRYTGISGSNLTGIPASGAGAIVASIAYNSTVTQAPALTGVPASGTGSILYAILKGADVNIWITVNDTAAQTALAALIGGDGIQEDYLQDRRLAKAEATDRGTAWLARSSAVEITVRYKSRDINTKSGQLASFNLGAPTSLIGDFIIQSVTWGDFYPSIMPTADVTASSSRLTLEDLLRFTRAQN